MNFTEGISSFSILKEAKLRIKAKILVSSIIMSSGLVTPVPKFEDLQIAINQTFANKKNYCDLTKKIIDA